MSKAIIRKDASGSRRPWRVRCWCGWRWRVESHAEAVIYLESMVPICAPTKNVSGMDLEKKGGTT